MFVNLESHEPCANLLASLQVNIITSEQYVTTSSNTSATLNRLGLNSMNHVHVNVWLKGPQAGVLEECCRANSAPTYIQYKSIGTRLIVQSVLRTAQQNV